jgi:quinol monooxygenase YgiN
VYYVVGERWLRPGGVDAYIAYAQQVTRDWADVTAQDAYVLSVERDRAEHVLIVGSWPDRAAFDAAYASIPPEMRDIAADAVVAGTGNWRWYGLAGELRLFGHEPQVATAATFSVPAEAAGGVREWAARVRAAAREVPGVVAVRLLESLEQPGAFVQMGIFADEVAADLAGAAAAEQPPTVPLDDLREFVGFVGFRWSQFDGRGRSRA